jgi:hypothetical protein
MEGGMPVELTREELKEAVAEGVRRALSELFAGINLADAVQQGTRAAFEGHDIEAAVKQAVSDSFPWSSEILGAIWGGTKEAVER